MKKLLYYLLLSIFLMFASCQTKVDKIGDFNLLPIPQKFEIKGSSALKYENIRFYCKAPDVEFPVTGEVLPHIEAVDHESEAQILCDIDETLDIRSEGYTLDITENQISLVGKDKAGLFYALKTLEQLLEDAHEQDVCLPLCSIRDYPLLSYRAIHLDMKHHLETREYYYTLIDKLAKYKINAIIAEMEDKIHYSRRPELSSTDALSIEEWRELSNYAKERNIEISPLIQ
ncbi:MAG: beta-N-acetylhexosaminidase, partial [Methanosarcinaceae archaeon]|nr:beta-N-acetylhexosaminidase [Methanosarcinaceae archaeon]